MHSNPQIRNSAPADIDTIFKLYEEARGYQELHGVVVWPEFERGLVEAEIAECRQWKCMIGDAIACVWATTHSDEQIWEERNIDESVYIHRIATNSEFRGMNFVGLITDWARSYAQNNELSYVRLDTLGKNWRLIEHYQKNGYDLVGFFQLKNTAGLPEHYQRGLPACLLEIKL